MMAAYRDWPEREADQAVAIAYSKAGNSRGKKSK